MAATTRASAALPHNHIHFTAAARTQIKTRPTVYVSFTADQRRTHRGRCPDDVMIGGLDND